MGCSFYHSFEADEDWGWSQDYIRSERASCVLLLSLFMFYFVGPTPLSVLLHVLLRVPLRVFLRLQVRGLMLLYRRTVTIQVFKAFALETLQTCVEWPIPSMHDCMWQRHRYTASTIFWRDFLEESMHQLQIFLVSLFVSFFVSLLVFYFVQIFHLSFYFYLHLRYNDSRVHQEPQPERHLSKS